MTLASNDTSGFLLRRDGEVEVERTRCAKKWHVETLADGRNVYRVGGSVAPIHYQEDPFEPGDWREIDLDVVITPGEQWDAACETNGYQVRLWQSLVRRGQTHRYVAQFRRAGKWLAMSPKWIVWENAAGEREVISAALAVGAPTINNDAGYVQWNDVFGNGRHFRYNLRSDKFFKELVVETKDDLPLPTISGPGLTLTLVLAVEWNAAPDNGFADGFQTGFGDSGSDLDAPDEELDDPDGFDHADERGRLWRMLRPMARDSADHAVPVTWRLVRKGSSVYACFSVSAQALNSPAAVYPVYVDTAISEEQVGASADDGYYTNGTLASISGTTIRLNYDSGTTHGFTRFQTVPIPAGATVNSASVSVYRNGTDAVLHTAIHTDSVANSPELTASEALATRTLSTASTAWSVTASSGWNTSPDIASPIQEVVSNGGWSLNNAISVIYAGDNDGRFLCWAYDGNTNICPKFNATYTEAANDVVYPPRFVIGKDRRRPGRVSFLPHPPNVADFEPQVLAVPPPRIGLGVDTRRPGAYRRFAPPTQDIARRYASLIGRYHIRSDAFYEFFRSTSGPPDVTSDTPFATATSLPDTPAVAWADGKWFVSMTYFNGLFRSQPYPVGANGEPYKIIVIEDSGATEAIQPPKGPVKWWLEKRSAGVIRVCGIYDDASVALRADAWSIAYTTGGGTPSEDANDIEVAFANTSGPERIAYDLPAQSNLTSVKVRLQTLRDDGAAGDVFSDDSVVKSSIADAQTDADTAFLGGGPR